MKFDVVVIGGGAMGCSAAFHMRSHKSPCSVVVVEQDGTYELAATHRATTGGVRRVFSLRENIELSIYSIAFYEDFAARTAVGAETFDPRFVKGGYLITASPDGREALAENFKLQTSMGLTVSWLTPADVARQFPSLRTDNLGAAIHSHDDGWLDPRTVLTGLRRKSEALGATFLADKAVAIGTHGRRATSVMLQSGTILQADVVVNAAGAWSKSVCEMVGMKAPIEPMLRYDFDIEIDGRLEPLPFVRDRGRVAFRPEGTGYRGGVQSTAMPRGFDFAIRPDYFDTEMRPALLERSEAFRSVRMKSATSGIWDQNEFDQNAIIGPWTGGLENFYLLTGFSGHGFMHAPGAGRAIAEMIIDRNAQSLDLANLGWTRISENRPFRERPIR